MQTVMAILATALMLTFLEFGRSTADAQAGSAFCRHRYNVCLARCAERRRCFPGCQSQYRRCIPPAPQLGDLI
jgi:hypothetical protein